MEGSCSDSEDAAEIRAELGDLPDPVSSEDSQCVHTSSEGEESEPADVRSLSHSYVLQTALQKNQSDPHFNPARSKIKQPINVLHEGLMSSLGGAVSDDNTPSDHGSVSGQLKCEQARQDDVTSMPSLSDENITAGRWIGYSSCL
jgi:hypothetical protein